MQLTGTVHEVMPIEKKGNGQARNFIVNTIDKNGDREFKNYIKFDLWGDKCDIIKDSDVGKEVTVDYNLKGNRWEKDGAFRYFNSLQAWKVVISSAEKITFSESDDNYEDDLPF